MRTILVLTLIVLAACVSKKPSASVVEQQELAWEIAQTQRAILLSTPVEVKYVDSGDPTSTEIKLEVPDDTGSEIDVRSSIKMLSIHGGNWQYPTLAVFSQLEPPSSEYGPTTQLRESKWASIESCPILDTELRDFEGVVNHRFDLFSLNEPRGGMMWDGDFYFLRARGYSRGQANLVVLTLSGMDGSPVATQMQRSLERLKDCWRDLP